ncbi:flippase-like domain-containing protein [Terrilactibacillus sp. BCM23-1]|uniref:Phosphatidylglycerol lysyltransferase n=1 Tax=Terrilactibacillus tamarindi TaxID=2599694 RepID=A0A6N8CLT4_9BACI|nr:lysylphosphatidylglycerol synthase transmembrane domain-containing protein [Terrilactibacillus tamarindi]MTT30791.1 flippase-like domain-containing protein [Terrilactibacillus tamarindi]
MTKQNRNIVLHILIIIVISALFFYFKFRHINLADFWTSMKEINDVWISLSMLVMFLYWLCEAIILYQMTKSIDPRFRFRSALQITMVGQFFNTLTPLQTGGGPAQLYMLKQKGTDIGSASSVLLIKFIIYQLVLVVNFIVILFFSYDNLIKHFPRLSYLVLLGFIFHLFVIIGLLIVAISKKTAHFLAHLILKSLFIFIKKEKRVKYVQTIDHKIDTFHHESRKMSQHRWLLVKGCLLTSIQLFLFFSIPYFIFEAIGISHEGLILAMAYHAFIIMFSSIVPTPSGTAGAEYSFTILFGSLMNGQELLVTLILWRFISSYSCLIIGGIALSFGSKKLAQLK